MVNKEFIRELKRILECSSESHDNLKNDIVYLISALKYPLKEKGTSPRKLSFKYEGFDLKDYISIQCDIADSENLTISISDISKDLQKLGYKFTETYVRLCCSRNFPENYYVYTKLNNRMQRHLAVIMPTKLKENLSGSVEQVKDYSFYKKRLHF